MNFPSDSDTLARNAPFTPRQIIHYAPDIALIHLPKTISNLRDNPFIQKISTKVAFLVATLAQTVLTFPLYGIFGGCSIIAGTLLAYFTPLPKNEEQDYFSDPAFYKVCVLGMVLLSCIPMHLGSLPLAPAISSYYIHRRRCQSDHSTDARPMRLAQFAYYLPEMFVKKIEPYCNYVLPKRQSHHNRLQVLVTLAQIALSYLVFHTVGLVGSCIGIVRAYLAPLPHKSQRADLERGGIKRITLLLALIVTILPLRLFTLPLGPILAGFHLHKSVRKLSIQTQADSPYVMSIHSSRSHSAQSSPMPQRIPSFSSNIGSCRNDEHNEETTSSTRSYNESAVKDFCDL